MHGPGPNDFHFDAGVQKPGLGADEPTEKMRAEAVANGEAERRQQEALERAKAEIATEAEALEDKRAALDAREAALAAREALLGGDADATAAADATKRRTTTRQATDRVSA